MPRLAPALAGALGVVLATTGATAVEMPTLLRPGQRMAVIDTAHIHALVPAHAAQTLIPFVQRAEALYVHLAADAGYPITRPLTLWLSDDVDDHNGFSTTVPIPLVQIELAPSLPRSGIFSGADETERTLIHELTHHISNDRVFGFRKYSSAIFGRVLPNEYLSLLTGYLTVPPHVTMPLFWHEGLAQWAETTYADPTSPWAGRGRDSLTHLVWRLDAAERAIPPVDEWRASYTRWPFGNRVYLYGLAYTRYLAGAYGQGASLWRLSEQQAHELPFVFDPGPEPVVGKSHAVLIDEARAALQTEQEAVLAELRSVPPTTLTRLTPEDTLVAAPAWQPDGSLITAFTDPYDTSRLVQVDQAGKRTWTWATAYARGEARSLRDGTTVYAETLGSAGDHWVRSRVVVRWPSGKRSTIGDERLLQPDIRPLAVNSLPSLDLVAIRLRSGGGQELIRAAWHEGIFIDENGPAQALPTIGRPWHPTFRPGHDELAWVETDDAGSRLILAPLADPTQRTVLATVKGRLIHPCFTADGASIFVCSDQTGVANAYRVDVAKPGILQPVTHVLGAVTACVPSPDGRELALVAFDRHGPFLARIANDPAAFPTRVPRIALAWPAPVAAQTANPGPALTPSPLPAPAAQPDPTPYTRSSYFGPGELNFLFWSPTTMVTREGGLGIQALAADPLYTNQLTASAGVGDVEGQAVGSAAYTWSPWRIGFTVAAWRSELTYSDQVVDSALNRYDYTETATTVEARAGYLLLGSERRLRANVALGSTSSGGVQAATDRYAGKNIISPAPFTGVERYAEYTLGWSDNATYPTSYTKEDGPSLVATYRQSGLGGELDRRRLIVSGAYTWSILPHFGHQVVGGGWVGWSDPDGTRTLQSAFGLGGPNNLLSPRGYPTQIVSGPYSIGYSAAYRLPVWRPFLNWSTTPFGIRQVVVEPFFDAGQISSDRVHGNGDWYRSAGGELAGDWEVWALRLDPVIGVAKQLDGEKHVSGYVRLGFRW